MNKNMKKSSIKILQFVMVSLATYFMLNVYVWILGLLTTVNVFNSFIIPISVLAGFHIALGDYIPKQKITD